MSNNTEAMRAALEAFLTGLEDSEHDSDVADCVRRHESRLAAALAQAEQRQGAGERLKEGDCHYAVHMSHCFQGEWEGGCKYGEVEICPAAPQPEEPDLPAILQRQNPL